MSNMQIIYDLTYSFNKESLLEVSVWIILEYILNGSLLRKVSVISINVLIIVLISFLDIFNCLRIKHIRIT